MSKISKLQRKLNDEVREAIQEEMKKEFQIEISTRLDFFGTGKLISTRVDKLPFNKKQVRHIRAFENGYLAAMNKVME